MSDFEKWFNQFYPHGSSELLLATHRAYLAGQASAEQRVKDLKQVEEITLAQNQRLMDATRELQARVSELERCLFQMQEAAKDLALKAQAGEPVAEVFNYGIMPFSEIPVGTKLYTTPSTPAAEPVRIGDKDYVQNTGGYLMGEVSPAAEQAMKDAVLCGTGILKDGKCIDPREFYKEQVVEPIFKPMPSPSAVELASPLFNAIWGVCKSWDVNAPEYYQGYCGFDGSHAKLILDAINAAPKAERPAAERRTFSEAHPRNPDAKCKCEHWQSCKECHPTAHES